MENFRRPVWIIDTTLRDGIRTAGVNIDYEEKYNIVKALTAIGINEIEAGIPSEGREEQNFIKQLNTDFPDTVITAWCSGVDADLQAAIGSCAESIHIAFPVSDMEMAKQGFNREMLLQKLVEVLGGALGQFEHISVGAQDASRADFEFLKMFIKTAGKYGIRRIRIADTAGLWYPKETIRMIRDIKLCSEVFLEFHGHDNQGQAAANSISAIQAGADAVSTILGGICHSSGNTELEEFLIYLAFAGRHRASVDLENLLDIDTRLNWEDVRNVELR